MPAKHRRLRALLVAAGIAPVALACDPISGLSGRHQGVIVANMITDTLGYAYATKPTAVFYENGHMDIDVLTREGCAVDQETGDHVFQEDDVEFYTRTLFAGDRMRVVTTTDTTRRDTILPTIRNAMFEYSVSPSIPTAPGDSLYFHIEGGDDFPATVIGARMVDTVWLNKFGAAPAGQKMTLTWIPAEPHPGAFVYVWFRFNPATALQQSDLVWVCHFKDDGLGETSVAFATDFRRLTLNKVLVARERISYQRLSAHREVFVLTRVGLPFPITAAPTASIRVSPE